MPYTDVLKNVMLNEECDIKTINYIKALSKSLGFTDTLFVSSAGDNSDGSSWEKAYTSLTTALDWVSSNQSTGESHLVMIGDGTFDINTTGNPEYTSINVALIGMGKSKTWITNSHTSATSILMFDGCGLTIAHLTLYTENNNINGLYLDDSIGSYAGAGVSIYDVDFRVGTPTGAHNLLYIVGSVERLNVDNCWFYGNNTHTTSLHLNDCMYSRFTNLYFQGGLIGIHLDHADDDHNIFKDIYFNWCVTCIQVDNAGSIGNYFTNIHFNYTYTTNIDDSSTTNYYFNIIKHAVSYNSHEQFYPDDLTGIAVTAGVGANTYGAADTEIRSSAAATEPYEVLGFVYEADTSEKWGMRFIENGSTGYATFSLVEGVANEAKVYYFDTPFIIRQGVALDCSVKSETGGNTVNIWIIIKTL